MRQSLVLLAACRDGHMEGDECQILFLGRQSVHACLLQVVQCLDISTAGSTVPGQLYCGQYSAWTTLLWAVQCLNRD